MSAGTSFGPDGRRVSGLNTAIVAADDDTRARLVSLLAEAGGEFEVTAILSTLEELQLLRDPPEAIVFDAGKEREERIRNMRRAFAESVLVAVVPGGNRRRLRSVLAEGADGVVAFERLDASLGATVRAACTGQVVVPRELRASIVKPSLSVREKQVLGMVVMGFTNGEIAQKLVLAESTIKSHLSSAFVKLGVRSRGEASELILDPANGLGPGILSIAGAEGQLGPDLGLEEPASLARR